MRVESRFVAAPLLLLAVAACGRDATTVTVAQPPTLRIVSGGTGTDTIGADLREKLVVEVRAEGGKPAVGIPVRFESDPLPDSVRSVTRARAPVSVCGVSGLCYGQLFNPERTDSTGRVSVRVRLGDATGRSSLRITVPEFGLRDSAVVTANPGNAQFLTVAATPPIVAIGGTQTLTPQLFDRMLNPRAGDRPVLSTGPATAISLTAASSTITGNTFGTQWVTARFGTLVDSAQVSVVPRARLVVWYPGGNSIRLLDTDGSNVRELTRVTAYNFGVYPRFDASRARITYQVGTSDIDPAVASIVVLDTTGTARRTIRVDTVFSVVLTSQLKADGRLVVIGLRVRDTTGVLSLTTIAADGTVSAPVRLPGAMYNYRADVSPDGTRVAYVGFNSAAFQPDLRLLNVATGTSTLLAANADSPRWSPQGDRIAYIDLAGDPLRYGTEGSLRMIKPDGTGGRLLDSAVFSIGINWAPAGDYIVGRTRSAALRVVRVADGVGVPLSFATRTGERLDYTQADWR